MSTHPRLTRLGDALDVASQWVIATGFWLLAVAFAVLTLFGAVVGLGQLLQEVWPR